MASSSRSSSSSSWSRSWTSSSGSSSTSSSSFNSSSLSSTTYQRYFSSIFFYSCTKSLISNTQLLLKSLEIYYNLVDSLGRNALTFASTGNLEVFKFLAMSGRDYTHVDLMGWSPIHWAARAGNVEVFRYLVEDRKIDMNLGDAHGMTPAMWACWSKDLGVLKYLVGLGIDLEVKDDMGWTATEWASRWNNTEAFNYLGGKVEVLVPVEGPSGDELMHAVRWGTLEEVKDLLEGEYDVGHQDGKGRTALIWAVIYNRFKFVKYLLGEGANISIRDDFQKVALNYAAENKNEIIFNHIGNLYVQEVDSAFTSGALGNLTTFFTSVRSNRAISASNGLSEVESVLLEEIDLDRKDHLGRTALISATLSGNVDIVQKLLEEGSNVDLQDNLGRTALMVAISNGNLQIQKDLLGRSPNLNLVDNRGWTALFYALQKDLQSTELLLEAGASHSIVDNLGKTPLMYAAEQGLYQICDRLVGYFEPVSIHSVSKSGKSALIYASEAGQLEAVKWLIFTRSSDLDLQDVQGRTALMYAPSDIAELLLEAGAEPDLQDDLGRTALMFASERVDVDTMGSLLKRGARIKREDKEGRTALFYAVKDLEATRLLLEGGALLEMKDKQGRTPLMAAAGEGTEDVVKELLDKGAKIDERDLSGRSALMYAAQNNLSNAKLLLDRGADVSLMDKNGKSALTYSVEAGFLEFAESLLEEGADLGVVDSKGRSLLMVAAEYNRLEFVKKHIEAFEVNLRDSSGYTVLTYASSYSGDRLPLVKFLIEEHGADLEVLDKYKQNAFHWAAFYGNLEILKYLPEEYGSRLNIDGRTPIFLAVQNGHMEAFEFLLDLEETDLKLQDRNGVTLLMVAAQFGRVEMASRILEKDPSTADLKDSSGRSVLFHARKAPVAQLLLDRFGERVQELDRNGENLYIAYCRYCDLKLIKLIGSKFADVNYESREGVTPLIAAAQGGNLEAFKHLLQKGADVRHRSKGGLNVLMWAARSGSLGIVKYLVGEMAFGVDEVDLEGYTAAVWAASYNQMDVLKYLAEAEPVGANLEVKDKKYGQTLIYWACWARNLEMVQYLVEERQVDLQVFDLERKTPLHIAANYGVVDIFAYLLQFYSDVYLTDLYGRTPLTLAVRNGHMDILTYLVDHGYLIDSLDPRGRTLLHVAAIYDQVAILTYLLDIQLWDINLEDKEGHTAIYLALEVGSLKAVHFLASYPSLEIKEDVISLACARNVDLSKELLEKCPGCTTTSLENICQVVQPKPCRARRHILPIPPKGPQQVQKPLRITFEKTASNANFSPSGPSGVGQLCLCNTLTLALLLQTYLERKFPLPQFQKVSPNQTRAIALNITEVFEKVLMELDLGVDFDGYTFYLEILEHLKHERFAKIEAVLGKYLGDRCVECETIEKIKSYFVSK